MKKIMIILLLFCLANVNECSANPDIEDAIYSNSQMADIADSNNQINKILPDFSFSDITRKLSGGEEIFNLKTVISDFLKLFSEEIYLNINIMLLIIVLAIISGIVNNIQSSYNSKSISEVAFFAFFTVFMGLVIKGLHECMTLASTVVSDQVLFMKSAIPVYIALILSSGNATAAVGMEPIFLYFVQLMGTLIERIILPLIFWIAVLNMVNCLTEKFSIKKLIEFVKQVIKWGMGILMTFFVSILSMSGLTSSIAGGLGIKTMKYAIGNFVPVVGGLLSDSVDTVLASTIVLKGAMGTAGVISLILMCAIPLIKMLSLTLIYKLTAGIIEPLSDKRITSMISEAGSTAAFIFAVLLTVTVMFILGITITLGVSNKFYTM